MSEPARLMPKRILIIGLLFVLTGGFAAWEIIHAAMHSRVSINFGVLLLPVGLGLLMGKRGAQWWARFFIIVGYILLGAIAVLSVTMPKLLTVDWFESSLRGSRAIPCSGFEVACPAPPPEYAATLWEDARPWPVHAPRCRAARSPVPGRR